MLCKTNYLRTLTHEAEMQTSIKRYISRWKVTGLQSLYGILKQLTRENKVQNRIRKYKHYKKSTLLWCG